MSPEDKEEGIIESGVEGVQYKVEQQHTEITKIRGLLLELFTNIPPQTYAGHTVDWDNRPRRGEFRQKTLRSLGVRGHYLGWWQLLLWFLVLVGGHISLGQQHTQDQH